MTGERLPWGARLAAWWVAAYTATAPEQDGKDRRAEVAADIADQQRSTDLPRRAVSRSIAGRVLRGSAADLVWRFSVEFTPGRAAWHLAHPATVIGALTALLVPLAGLADVLRRLAAGSPTRALGLVQAAVGLDSALILAIAFTALVRWLTVGHRSGVAGVRRGRLRTVRGWAAVACCVAASMSAIWRFAPGVRGQVATVAYAIFGVAVLTWLAAAVALAVVRLGRPGAR
jgi:hypothetical protein